MKTRSLVLAVVLSTIIIYGCALFQGSVLPEACTYAKEVCATATTLCNVLENSSSTSAQVDSAKTAFLIQVQAVTATANNRTMELRKAGR